MVVRRIELTPVRLPFETRQRMSPDWLLDALYAVVVEAHDADGSTGVGYAYTFNRRYMRPLAAMIEALAELTVGADPTQPERHWARLARDVAGVNAEGLGQMAIAALDIALWDLRGKLSGQPVHRLLEVGISVPVEARWHLRPDDHFRPGDARGGGPYPHPQQAGFFILLEVRLQGDDRSGAGGFVGLAGRFRKGGEQE